MPSKEEIIYTADRIEDDADVLRDAVSILAKRGASQHLRKQLQNRIDEWTEQAETMRKSAGEYAR